jgi:hypothetical protein
MKSIKSWIALLTLSAMVATSTENVNAYEYATDAGGYAYEDAVTSTSIAPAIVLALVAIAGIIAVGVHNRSHSSHNNHDHSD